MHAGANHELDEQMTISDSQLVFDTHLDFYKKLRLLTGDEKCDAYYIKEAQRMHSLCVIDGLFELLGDAITLANRIKADDAQFHLRFGVSRRVLLMWHALRDIVRTVDPAREVPLPRDDLHRAEASLNLLYINLRGTLDNFAWCLRDFCGDTPAKKMDRMQVNLFRDEFVKAINFPEIVEFMSRFSAWNGDLAARRDPAAHRIPLTIPPAIIDAAARKNYEEAMAEYNAAIEQALKTDPADHETRLSYFEQASVLSDKVDRVGAFLPVFYHHPREGMVYMYPTIPADVGTLIAIARGLSAAISAKLN